MPSLSAPCSSSDAVAWRLSVFSIEHSVAGRNVLFNTRTRRFYALDRPLCDLISIRPSLVSRFADLGLIVRKETSVGEEYRSFLEERSSAANRLNLIFTVTTGCDLSCGYCFENRVKRAPMRAEIVDAVASWAEQYVKQHALSEIALDLFGGEPLLEPEMLCRFLTRMQRCCVQEKLKFDNVQLTTNGRRCDPAVLLALRKLGVNEVQVTIDGNESTTNARRRVRDPASRSGSAYRDVICNIKAYAKYFQVTVKINFDRSTIATCTDALDDLAQASTDVPSVLTIKPEPIAAWAPGNLSGRFGRLYERMSSDLAQAFGVIMHETTARGFALDLSAVFPTPCMVSGQHSFLVEPDGSLRSCISAFGMDAFWLGQVTTAGTTVISQRHHKTEFASTVSNGCSARECSYLPVCDGGCKYEAHFAGLQPEDMLCGYEYYSAVVPILADHWLSTARSIDSFRA